jgi:GGDEF domain-containing protein
VVPSIFEPAYGSLGLLGQDAALARLEEEVVRAERSDRAVLLLLLDADVHESSSEARPAALRAVARVVESAAESQDIPFALAADRFGIVFPDTNPAAVWDVVDRILATVATATYPHGATREARPLQSAVELRIGLAQQSTQATTAQGILDEAVAALERGRSEQSAT